MSERRLPALRGYDRWKSSNPADEWLGPEPQEEEDGMPDGMNPRDIVKTHWQASQRGALAIWTIYDKPPDHPEGYFARLFEVADGETVATGATMAGALDQMRASFERAGLVNISRQEGDDPKVVESWI
jgi:hypothetical protein